MGIKQVSRTVFGAVEVSTVCVREGRSVSYLTAVVGPGGASDSRAQASKADALREHDFACDVVRGYATDAHDRRVAFYRSAMAEVAS